MVTELLFRLVIDENYKSLYAEHEHGGEQVLLARASLAVTRGGGEDGWRGIVGAALDAFASETMR